MQICICDSCRYTFRYPITPSNCPDCGSKAVRKASDDEIKVFELDQKTLREEIQAGLYASGT